MTQCVILFRYHRGNVDYVGADDDDGEIAVFKNRDDAIAYARTNHLFQAIPYQIVELDEL